MPPSPPLVTVLILNTNRKDDTLACVQSLQESTYPNQAIILLDNASTDGSVEAVSARFPEVRIVHLTQNLGYTGNNNVGIQIALEQGADWVFILNEDTIVAPDCIAQLVAAGEADPAIGILGPLVFHYSEPEVIQSAGGSFDRLWRSQHIGQNDSNLSAYAAPRQVDWVTGCSLLARASVLSQIGGFDERFYYYYEETELCVRANRAGWKIQYVPSAKIWHKGVQVNYAPKPSVTYYSVRNHLMMLSKHHAPLPVQAAAWLDDLKTIASWTLRPKWRSQHGHRDAAVQAMGDYLRHRTGKRPE